jgi:hypothetical protein
MKPIRAFWLAALVCVCGTAALAGEVDTKADGTTVWQAGIDGVEIEWGSDGSFSRIYSRYTQPVAFPDRQGITTAQTIAEEKAKAAIVRFIDQEVASKRVVAEVQNTMNQSTRERGTGKEANITKTSQRQMIENLTEVTTSAAAGKLRGVIILERGYDEKDEVAWVKVGISQKTMRASDSLKDGLTNKSTVSKPADSEERGTRSKGSSIPLPGSEVQRPQQKDW